MSVLTRHKSRAPSELRLSEDISLPLGRAHEICGASRLIFALEIAARMQGPILWLRRSYGEARLNADGIAPYFNPGRLMIVNAIRLPDLLWSMEECLRAGIVPLVITELPEPPGLTPVRRLHLAAETGQTKAAQPPLGLLLTPGQGGAPGVETRWHVAPHPGWATPDHIPRWRVRRTRARMAPEAGWLMQRHKGQTGFTPLRGTGT